MQRDKQSPLELIKYAEYIQKSFDSMRVQTKSLWYYNITICFLSQLEMKTFCVQCRVKDATQWCTYSLGNTLTIKTELGNDLWISTTRFHKIQKDSKCILTNFPYKNLSFMHLGQLHHKRLKNQGDQHELAGKHKASNPLLILTDILGNFHYFVTSV